VTKGLNLLALCSFGDIIPLNLTENKIVAAFNLSYSLYKFLQSYFSKIQCFSKNILTMSISGKSCHIFVDNENIKDYHCEI